MQVKGKLLDATMFEQEIPSGLVNSSNQVFTLSATPHSAKAVVVMLNGIIQRQPTDYGVANTTITFSTAPATGQKIYAFYIKR